MPDTAPLEFRQQILKFGVISYNEQDKIYDIAKKCATQIGLPMGAGGAAIGAKAGTVVLPGGATVPGALAGFLAGLFGGTIMCTVANTTYRDELRRLLD